MSDQTPSSSASGNEIVDGVPAPEGPTNLIDTDYQIGQDNLTANKFGLSFDLPGKVFTISALVIVFFVVTTLAFQNEVEPIFSSMRDTCRNIITEHGQHTSPLGYSTPEL